MKIKIELDVSGDEFHGIEINGVDHEGRVSIDAQKIRSLSMPTCDLLISVADVDLYLINGPGAGKKSTD